MALLDALIGPVVSIIDKVIPDKAQRDKAKLELPQLQGSQDLSEINARLSAIVAEANSRDPWTSRARPSSFTSCTCCCCGRCRRACWRCSVRTEPQPLPQA